MSALERLDWRDTSAVTAWLESVRVALADADGVALDLLRPLRRRDLGHRNHARLHREAREKLAALLEYATSRTPPGAAWVALARSTSPPPPSARTTRAARDQRCGGSVV